MSSFDKGFLNLVLKFKIFFDPRKFHFDLIWIFFLISCYYCFRHYQNKFLLLCNFLVHQTSLFKWFFQQKMAVDISFFKCIFSLLHCTIKRRLFFSLRLFQNPFVDFKIKLNYFFFCQVLQSIEESKRKNK